MKLVSLGLLIALLAGCQAPDQDNASARAGGTDGSPSASASSTSADLKTEEVDTFDSGWALEFLPESGDLLITERTGALYLRDAETGDRVEVGGVPEVAVAGQGGLGDVIVSPTYGENQIVYLSWAEADGSVSGAAVGRARLVTDGDAPKLEDLDVIWRQRPKVSGSGHFAHRLAFDPGGEQLFVTSGDRQKLQPAQDTTNTLGTIVRLTPDGSPAAGNPLADRGGAAAEIYSWGHRNPLGIDFDSEGNLWSTEMGPEGGDELNLIEAGGNYGWPEASNGSHYGGGEIPDHSDGDGFVGPVASWTPSISPSGMIIYTDDLIADWTGDAFIGALSGEALIRVGLNGTKAGEQETVLQGKRIRDVEQAPDGSMWVLEDGDSGRLLRLAPS